MNKIRGALRSITIWVNGLFLAVFPFAEQIMAGIHDNLPQLENYLPINVFKTIGLILVVFNIYQRTRTSKSLEVKGQP